MAPGKFPNEKCYQTVYQMVWVSRLCAAQELILLGVAFDTDVVSREKQLEIDKANQRKKAKEKRLQRYSETYYYYWDVVGEEDWIEHDEGILF